MGRQRLFVSLGTVATVAHVFHGAVIMKKVYIRVVEFRGMGWEWKSEIASMIANARYSLAIVTFKFVTRAY